MVLFLIIVLILAAAGAAAWFLGPEPWRETTKSAARTLGRRFGDFVERGRGPEPVLSAGGQDRSARPARFSEADRAYLDRMWEHAQTKFVSDPRVAVNMAHSTASGFFKAHGVDVGDMPGAVDGGAPDTEMLRLRLLAIKAWADREVAA